MDDAEQRNEIFNRFVNIRLKQYQEAVIGLKRLTIMWGGIVLDDEQEKVLDGEIAESEFDIARAFSLMLKIMEQDMQGYIDAYSPDYGGNRNE